MPDYSNHDTHNVSWLMGRALDRDCQLTKEEAEYKQEAEMECEFGPKWWLRAHP